MLTHLISLLLLHTEFLFSPLYYPFFLYELAGISIVFWVSLARNIPVILLYPLSLCVSCNAFIWTVISVFIVGVSLLCYAWLSYCFRKSSKGSVSVCLSTDPIDIAELCLVLPLNVCCFKWSIVLSLLCILCKICCDYGFLSLLLCHGFINYCLPTGQLQ